MLPFLEEGQQNSAAVPEDFVRANSEQLKEWGSMCVHGACPHGAARLCSPKHHTECYRVLKYFLKGQLSWKAAKHPFSAKIIPTSNCNFQNSRHFCHCHFVP